MKTKRKQIRSSSSSLQHSDLESSDLYTAAVRIAVAQICNSVGYGGAQTSALDTLTDVAVRYLQSLAKSAANSASSTGRTQCNLLDIIRALEDLHSNLGFYGNSDLKKRLYILGDSSILRDTMRFVYLTHEIPFAKPLPRRRHIVPARPPCFISGSAKWNHIPRWLPAFPKIADVGVKTVQASIKEETVSDKQFITTESNRKISKLPEKRKKVSFTIGCGVRNVIKIESGIDLTSGICKGGKRISFPIYDDENFINASSNSNIDHHIAISSMKKKLQKQTCPN